tara:strand:+ start:1777 stop:2025 length:249 start_codon:yes stop_codon:yes gene_type:complete
MYYHNLNVSQITDIKLIEYINNNLESEYININDNIYSIYMCEMDNITYLVSKIEYKSLEFKKLFNFKDDFSNFYKGKIVKII